MQAPQTQKENKETADADENKASGSAKKAPGAFRTISEVGDELDVQQHVLRFWETKFTQIKPLKRGGGRRYYRPEDVALLKRIHHLLYTEGYTIKGVQKLLRGQPKSQIVAGEDAAAPVRAQQAPVQQQFAPQPAPVLTAKRPAASAPGAPFQPLPEQKGHLSGRQRAILEAMLGDLRELRGMIKGQ